MTNRTPTRPTDGRRVAWTTAAVVAILAPVVAVNTGGCGGGPATTQPMSVSQRQDQILRDPMNYKPQVGPDSTDGDVTHLDGTGLKRDLNDVFNP